MIIIIQIKHSFQKIRPCISKKRKLRKGIHVRSFERENADDFSILYFSISVLAVIHQTIYSLDGYVIIKFLWVITHS